MNGFLLSFQPILKRLKKFNIEIFILSIAVVIAIVSLILYLHESKTPDESSESIQETVLPASPSHMIVDIAGAVERPGVYEVTSGARLKDALIQAGGLSVQAEREYVARNFNLAKLVTDQEKIYIPSIDEISKGIFAEPQKILDYTGYGQDTALSLQNKININTATLEELDTLAGIGKTIAQKIIQNRPYKNIEELSIKKVISKSIFEKIKNLITN